MNKKIEQTMSITVMRMLRRISGITREDIIRNEYIGCSIGAASIVDKKK